MADNNLVLIDSLLNKLGGKEASSTEMSEAFELFSFNQILKDYALSQDEIDTGWVDGSDDGGIDGFFTFIDGHLVTEKIDSSDYRKRPEVELIIITCKHQASFTQTPINTLLPTISELFDLSRKGSEFTSVFNEEVLRARELFSEAYVELIDKSPKLKVRLIYVSRGRKAQIAKNVNARAELLIRKVKEDFSDATVQFEFIGSEELLALYRKSKTFSLRLKHVENAINRGGDSYVTLCRLDDYYKFITDEEGKLRRYLFDSNVRDYLGKSLVNQEIMSTLTISDRDSDLDFWQLNNGVTVLSSTVNGVGKEMSLENIQIVNGLQTTETIYRYFLENNVTEDSRAVLVKVIIAKDELTRDRIIKATNNQNRVDLTSLRATDKLQKDIEDALLAHDWFYDRRNRQYINEGKPPERIISVKYLAQSILAIGRRNLEAASKNTPHALNSEKGYDQLFIKSWSILVYRIVVDIRKSVERLLDRKMFDKEKISYHSKTAGLLFGYVITALKLGKREYDISDLLKLDGDEITDEDMSAAWVIVKEARDAFFTVTDREFVKRPTRNTIFIQKLNKVIDESLA